MASTLTTAGFVARAIAVHGHRYDYSGTIYCGQFGRVEIQCPVHGVFQIVARSHLRGMGCKQCGDSRIFIPGKGGRKPRKTTAQFIAGARAIHGDTFNYDKTIYRGAQEQVIITCKTHGDFRQLATNHLSGYGCAECAVQKVFHESHIPPSKRNDPAWVYVMLIDVDGIQYAKVGYTTNTRNRRSRMKSERVFTDKSYSFETTKLRGFSIERELHGRLAAHKVQPSRTFGGSTECYPAEMYDRLVSELKRIIKGKVY